MPIGNPGGYLPPQVLDEYEAVKKTRADVMQKHQEFSANLQKKQHEVQVKQDDLTLSTRMMKALDPNVPKSAQQFLIREIATNLGVDPKTEQFKNVSKMISSLDPDSMQALRSTISSTAGTSNPGEVQQVIRGVFTGDVPMYDFINMIQNNQRGQGGQNPLSDPGSSAGDQTPSSGGPNLDRQSNKNDRVVKPFQEGDGENAVRSFEGDRTILPGDQQASPQLVGALGIDSTKAFRNNDLIKNGYRIPFDPKAQDELARSINTRSTGISQTIREAGIMTNLFEGRPEVLGPVGGFVRGLQSTVRQAEGFMRMLQPEAESDVDINDSMTRQIAADVSQRLAQAHGIDPTAEDSARIQSMVLGLAYRMAIARDIPGNRLTNAIINQHLVQLGKSSSPEQFKAVIKDTVISLVKEFDDSMRRTIGTSGSDIVARQLTNDDMAMIAENADMVPDNLVIAVRDEAVARRDEKDKDGLQPSSPTIEQEQQTLGRAEIAEKESKIAQRDFQNQLSLSQEVRAREAASRAENREERMTKAQIKSNELERERFDFQKDKYEEAKQQKRMDDIGDAFMAFGAAIARGGGGSISGVGIPTGGNQDTGAFRITPAPQRVAPAIPGRGR